MIVELTFPNDARDSLLDGRRTMLAAPTRLCGAGDEFDAFGARFRVIYVTDATLVNLAIYLHGNLGFSSPSAFLLAWRRKYPNQARRTRSVYYHRFVQVAPVAASNIVDLTQYRESQEVSA